MDAHERTGNRGYDEGVAGHITVRVRVFPLPRSFLTPGAHALSKIKLTASFPQDPVRPDCFWVNPFGLHFKLIQPSDLLLVNHAGEILEESGQKDGPFRVLNTAAFMIHS